MKILLLAPFLDHAMAKTGTSKWEWAQALAFRRQFH
jgi:hypothetical protein